ncbi:MAG TPA: DMT family transporter [Candidatus Omnitrophota bacterium]|nr:DMT family transporter [Candidatus Omnitrophota bacterium]
MNQTLISKKNLSGIFYIVSASFGFSLMAVCVKWVSRDLPSMEIVFFRSALSTLMFIPIMMHQKISFRGHDRPMLLLRGLSGFIALSLHFLTIAKLPLGVAVVLNYTAPIFAVILAIFFLNEKPDLFLWGMVLISFSGIFLLTGARLQRMDWYIFLGLLSGLFAAVAYIAIRSVADHDSPLTIIFYFTAISTVGSGCLAWKTFVWPSPAHWIGIFALSVGAFFGQLWMTLAYRNAPAALISPFSYLTPTFVFIAGAVIWKDPFTTLNIFGALLIILAGCFISLREILWESPS